MEVLGELLTLTPLEIDEVLAEREGDLEGVDGGKVAAPAADDVEDDDEDESFGVS